MVGGREDKAQTPLKGNIRFDFSNREEYKKRKGRREGEEMIKERQEETEDMPMKASEQ